MVELKEGETDKDEMFWTMLGDNDYAKADYWQWRRTAMNVNPRAWHIDATKGKNAVGLGTIKRHRCSQSSNARPDLFLRS